MATMSELAVVQAAAQTVRVLSLLDALGAAGVVPCSSQALHEVAYLANVLAPVFDLSPLDAALLKRQSGPYYPALQQTIDRLVARGLVEAVDLRYELDDVEKRYRIRASYRLCRDRVGGALNRYQSFYPIERTFLDELAAAYSALADADQGDVATKDARYADGSVDINNVIDFGQWATLEKNFSRNAAMTFAPGLSLAPAERLYLYLDHLNKKVANGR